MGQGETPQPQLLQPSFRPLLYSAEGEEIKISS